MKKRFTSLLCLLALICTLFSGCGQSAPAESIAPAAGAAAPESGAPAETREFTDSCGRIVALPAEIKKIAVSGPLTQVYLFPLCPELFAGFSSSFSEDAAKYIPEEYLSLPELGQLYGGKGTMDLEALLAAAPDVVLDVGEAKGSIAEDLDALTEQTGIPFVHVDATVATAPEAYLRLGELTGKTEKAQALSDWCRENYAMIEGMMAKVDADGARKNIVYCLGDKGLNVLAQGSFHAETLNMLGNNVAELTEVVSSGLGNEVDAEQLILWNPDVIIFAPDSVYDSVGTDPVWQQLDAVKSGQFYKTPVGPYGWLASPPSVQRYLGMLWLGTLLYPDYAEYDLQEKVTEYYGLFYGYELTDADYAALTANSLPAEK